MWWLLLVPTIVHSALAGNLYSPAVYGGAGLPYITQPVAVPTGYASALRTSVGYGPLAAARLNALAYSPGVGVSPGVAAPLAAPVSPVVPGYPAPVAPVVARYGTPVTPVVAKYAAVPAVADVPVTKFEAQPGFVQNYVDVAHQKLATSKLQIRRPAVQKSFYDIEERIVVRPVGSAVVEFDQPTSRSQSRPTILRPAVARYFSSAHPIHVAPFGVTHLPSESGDVSPPTSSEQYLPPPPSAPSSPEEPNQGYPSTEEPTPAPPQAPSNFPSFPPQQPPQQGPNFPITSPDDDSSQFDDSDSITIENPEARFRSQQPMQERGEERMMNSQFSSSQQRQRMFATDASSSSEGEFQARFGSPVQQQQLQQQQPQQQQFQQQPQPQQFLQEPQPQPQLRQQQLQQPQQFLQQQQPQPQLRQQQPQQPQQQQTQQPQFRASEQQTEARFIGETSQLSSNSFIPQSQLNNIRSESTVPQTRSFTPSVIFSTRSRLSEEENMQNQERLIELLTGRNGVAEVRSGVSVESLGEAGQVRARVLSVTPAPPTADGNERVSTRRIVVSRPIQTLQEVDVVQPFTKLQRVAVQQPALIKTARVGLARVNTLAPVPVASYSPYAYVH